MDITLLRAQLLDLHIMGHVEENCDITTGAILNSGISEEWKTKIHILFIFGLRYETCSVLL